MTLSRIILYLKNILLIIRLYSYLTNIWNTRLLLIMEYWWYCYFYLRKRSEYFFHHCNCTTLHTSLTQCTLCGRKNSTATGV